MAANTPGWARSTVFYGSSDPAGYYDQIIGDKLVTYLEQEAFASVLIGDSAHRAIGGVGEGAYGAYRAALKHPGVFSAIAATDGPLDFDGVDGNSGLIPLFQQSLNEQGLTAATYRNFDSSIAWPISRMFVGGALAFSPHITQVADSFTFTDNGRRTWLKIVDTIPDVTTLITRCVQGQGLGSIMINPGVGNIDWDFHLPFDSLGQVYHPIWDNYWMPNNLENMYQAAPTSLNNMKLWFATSQQAEYGFFGQTQSWITTLKNNGLTGNMTEMRYTGYSGAATTNNKYLYDVMRDMLIFYSNSFGAN